MQFRNTINAYGAVTQAFHWLTVCLVGAMFPIAWWMDDLPLGPEKFEAYGLHKSIGICILALTLLRLAWTLANPKPRVLGQPKPYEEFLAKAAHWSFYGILLAMPVIGWINSSAANFPVNVFGWFTLPALVGPDKELKELAQETHELLSDVLLVIIALHVAGALKHAVIWKDGTIRRMLPGYRPDGAEQ